MGSGTRGTPGPGAPPSWRQGTTPPAPRDPKAGRDVSRVTRRRLSNRQPRRHSPPGSRIQRAGKILERPSSGLGATLETIASQRLRDTFRSASGHYLSGQGAVADKEIDLVALFGAVRTRWGFLGWSFFFEITTDYARGPDPVHTTQARPTVWSLPALGRIGPVHRKWWCWTDALEHAREGAWRRAFLRAKKSFGYGATSERLRIWVRRAIRGEWAPRD